ncbi:hypothetical protein KXS11_09070 [Plantibacter flavus]|uniref:hypothetical protein n=1 Tax=Plantibacter flavus TaxID=150123 RepID=UPI003F165BE2
MTAAPAPTTDGFTLIGRHPVRANLLLIGILSGIAAAVLGGIGGGILGAALDIEGAPAVAIAVCFLAIAGACLTHLGVAYRRVGIDAVRGTALIDGQTIPLRSITTGALLTRTPAATTPVLSLRLTTDTGTQARIIVNGGWLRHLPTADLAPLAALIAGSGIPDDTGEDPLDTGRERISRTLAGKGTDVTISRRGFIIDCISAAEATGDATLLDAVITAAGPIGRQIRDESERIGRDTTGGQDDARTPLTTPEAEPTPLVPPPPRYGAVDGGATGAIDTAASDDDRFRRPDDPARVAAAGTVDRGHIDKPGDRSGEVGDRIGELDDRDTGVGEQGPEFRGPNAAGGAQGTPPSDRGAEVELPSWVQPKDQARMRAWLADDELVVHMQPIAETTGARTLRRVCDWILIGLVGVGFLAIIVAAVAERVIDSLLPSDANGLVGAAVIGAALLAFVTWILGGIARSSEIRTAQRVSLDWLDERGSEQRRRGLPPVLLQHFLGPIPGARLLAAGAYGLSVLGGIGIIAGALLTVDPEDLGAATGPIMLGVSIALAAAGTALFLLRWHRVKRQRAFAIELGGERLAFLGNL